MKRDTDIAVAVHMLWLRAELRVLRARFLALKDGHAL